MSATVEISWSAENNGFANHYNVYRSASSPVPLTTPINTADIPSDVNTYYDPSVPDGTYYYVIEAVDGAGNTEITPEYSVTFTC